MYLKFPEKDVRAIFLKAGGNIASPPITQPCKIRFGLVWPKETDLPLGKLARAHLPGLDNKKLPRECILKGFRGKNWRAFLPTSNPKKPNENNHYSVVAISKTCSLCAFMRSSSLAFTSFATLKTSFTASGAPK